MAFNRDEVPVRARSGGDLAERVRRAEDYAALGARVVVELYTEPRGQADHPRPGDHPPHPARPPPAPATDKPAATAGRSTAPAAPTGPAEHAPQVQEREVTADTR